MGAAELRPHRGKGLSQICPRPKPADASGESGSFWITGFSLGGHLFPGVQDHTVGPGRLEENSPSQPVSLLLTPAPRGQGGWGPAGSRGGWIPHREPPAWPRPSRGQPPTPICPGHPSRAGGSAGSFTAHGPPGSQASSRKPYHTSYGVALPENRKEPTPGRPCCLQTHKPLGEL